MENMLEGAAEKRNPPESTQTKDIPAIATSSSKKTPADIMKAEEAKLKSKFPGVKSGKSEFLRNRMAKKKVYFDSGEYNMIKSKESHSQKKISQTPVIINEPSGSGSDSDSECLDCVPSLVPKPQEQTIPTPEELILRRASLHMPKNKPLPEQLLMRRATVQVQRAMSTGTEANPLEILGEVPALCPEHLGHKKMPAVPSKLAKDG